MEIHERVQQIRKELKLSRKAFGEKLGVSGDVINNIENNRLKRPDQKEPVFRLICEKFDIDEEWLRTGNGNMKRQLTRDEAIVEWAASLVKDEEKDLPDPLKFAKSFAEMLSKLTIEDWKLLEKMTRLMGKKKSD